MLLPYMFYGLSSHILTMEWSGDFFYSIILIPNPLPLITSILLENKEIKSQNQTEKHRETCLLSQNWLKTLTLILLLFN